MQKTNAMRALDQRKIPYEAHEFSDAIRSADGVAATLGVPEAEVFKTLVVLPEARGKKPMLVMLPASKELDLRRFARAVGEKSVRMASQREAEHLTGPESRRHLGARPAWQALHRLPRRQCDRARPALRQRRPAGSRPPPTRRGPDRGDGGDAGRNGENRIEP